MKVKSQRGFTLIESIIALAVGAMVASGLLMLHLLTQNVNRSTASQLLAKREGYGFVELLAMQLRQANLVRILDNGDTLELLAPDGNMTRVYFEPGIDENPFTPEDNTIRLIRNLDQPSMEEIIVRRVAHVGTDPIFSRSGNEITILLRVGDALDSPTVDRITGVGQQGFEVQTTVFLRNA